MHVSESWCKDTGLLLASSMTASNTSIGSLGWMDMIKCRGSCGVGKRRTLGELWSGTKDDPTFLNTP